ncbi:hypothetical protein [Nonomuraea jabiensis]|uniref:hypothetical protein n=1 Tax=Nonomuraea jabiensis TaxID=882448 RepID=UPI003D7219CB
MVFLAVRPRGGTPGWHVLGRETFLAPGDLGGRPGTISPTTGRPRTSRKSGRAG